jgi:hypothetical protein
MGWETAEEEDGCRSSIRFDKFNNNNEQMLTCYSLDDSDEELFRRTGNFLATSTVLRAGTIDCLRCADFKHDVAHSVSIRVYSISSRQRFPFDHLSTDDIYFVFVFVLETFTISRISSDCTYSTHSWTQSISQSVSSTPIFVPIISMWQRNISNFLGRWKEKRTNTVAIFRSIFSWYNSFHTWW